MKQNLILQTDSYKLVHWKMYPAGTQHVYSYLEARTGATYPQTVFFGLQYLLKEYLEGIRVTREVIEEAYDVARAHFSHDDMFNLAGWWDLAERHGGRLPIRIRAVPEGVALPAGTPLLTIENTDPKLPWLTNALESLLMKVWYPTTVASLSTYMRDKLGAYCEATGGTRADSLYMLHDFGYRGVSSEESASLGGAAHLLCFQGTDTLQAMRLLQHYYGASLDGLAHSVAASEHSIMTAGGRRMEIDLARRIIAQHPNQIVSLVADSYDYYAFVDAMIAEKELIDRCRVQLVIRPDSPTSKHPKPQDLVQWTLWRIKDKLGCELVGDYKRVPYKVLWGDGIGPDGILDICETVRGDGFAVQNLVFGMGAGLLQKVNRDTQRFAIKCSARFVDGAWQDVQKDPLDTSKRSKAGRFQVFQDSISGEVKVVTDGSTPVGAYEPLLQPVFENGVILRQQTFDQIMRR